MIDATNKTYEIEIDLDKILQGINNWEEVVDAIMIGVDKGIRKLADTLKSKIIENLISYGLGNSNIIKTIDIKYHEHGALIQIGAEYAVYVEFGTGIVGSNNPHPLPLDWQYDVNNHGESGWWYPTTNNDLNPTKKIDKKTGQLYAWTKGQKSRPFLYDAWLWGTKNAIKIISNSINDEIVKVRGVK